MPRPPLDAVPGEPVARAAARGAVVTPIGARRRPSTATSRFGSSRREAHDASAFYERFSPPEVSDDVEVAPPAERDVIHLGDARRMTSVATASVALVVTSPPYFAGKEYEADLDRVGVPASYLEYLQLLREVFAECVRVLEPGGRIAVNVANLGRRPYRSLSADVTGILQDDLGLLMRGEVVWLKGRAATGSCAWGSFQSPSNPVLRDLTERVVVAAKGRFSRALDSTTRAKRDLPHEATVTRDEFLEATTDVWELPPESARRVGHPAPFPVELPRRIIELYTYRGDLVLDPFIGSGTTAVAAVRSGRHYVGFDTDPAYVASAQKRVAIETERAGRSRRKNAPSASDPVSAAIAAGAKASDVARLVLASAGFSDVGGPVQFRQLGVTADLTARDRAGGSWTFLVCGAYTSARGGLARTEALWRALGQAAVLHAGGQGPVVLLTTELPAPGSPGAAALHQVTGPRRPVRAAVAFGETEGRARLGRLARRPAR